MNNALKVILSMSLSGSVIALIIFTVRPLIKESFSKAIQYYVWLIVILRLLIPFSPEASLVGNLFEGIDSVAQEKAASLVPTAPILEIRENVFEQDPEYMAEGQSVPRQQKAEALNYMNYGWFVWIAAAISLFAIKLLRYIGYIHYIKAGSCVIKNGEALELFRQMEKELGIRRNIPLYQSKLINSPMLIGQLKPAIFIPQAALSIENLRYVFKHELLHYKRFDIWYKWLIQLTVCIHWFNPVIHIMSRQINSLCEFSCDEAVTQGLGPAEKMEYCNTILNVISFNIGYKGNSIPLTLCEGKKSLKERLGSILNGNRITGKTYILSVVFILVLCCAAVTLGAFSSEAHMVKPAPEAAVAGKQEPVKKTVVIDPGHGGTDTGFAYSDVNYFDFSEKDRNLEVSLLLRDMLTESGVNAVLTRQEDQQLSLEARMEQADALNPSLFVSIHFNAAADNKKHGTFTMYNSLKESSAGGTTSERAAQLLHNEIINELGTEDAGMTAMTESLKYNGLKMPAVIVELAFVSNESDRDSIMSEGFDSAAAKALHKGILSALDEV